MVHSKRMLLLSLVLVAAVAVSPGFGQSDAKSGAAPSASSQAKPPATAEVKLSRAERILRLEQGIDQTRQELAELKKQLEDPEGEYAKSKAEFTRLDKRLKERELELTTQPADDPTRIEGLKNARQLAKERFDLAIQAQTALQQKYTLAERKLQQDEEALARLRVTTSQPAAVPPGGPATPGSSTPAVGDPSGETGPAPGLAPTIPQTTVKVPGVPGVSLPAPTVPQAPADEPTRPTGTPPAPMQKELVEARKEAERREAAAREAEQTLESVAARIATLRENIKAEQQTLEIARQQSANAAKRRESARAYAQKLVTTGAPTEEINKAWGRYDEAETQSAKAEQEVNKSIEKLDDLQAELTDLQAEHITMLQETERAREEAQEADKKVRRLQNPYSLFRVLQWLIDHGPPITGILLGMLGLLWLIKVTEHRIVRLIALRGDTGTENERESRAKTLASVFKNVGSTAIVVGAILMLLTEVNINIVPLLGAAGVVGLAVAFGAQSLIKDYFSGFIILLENQYGINDVVRIGSAAGMVEHISLRMTVLRDTEGNAHFIPHGEIKSVTNMTHGWSRAVFDIGVAYREPVDRVMKVLLELARELRKDPAFSPLILDDPEMLGVDNLGDSAVVIRFLIKTRPLRQWTIKREMLRRIKNRFDELGIEIPFPHRTVYHRYESNGQAAEPPEDEVLAPIGGRSQARKQ